MEAVANTDSTTILEHDDEESGYLTLTEGSREALTESNEECESNEDQFDGASGWEEEDGTVNDGYNDEDEGTTYEKTEICEPSYGHDEYDEANRFEDEERPFDDFNEENEATQRPVAGFDDDSGYEVDGSGEHDQASRLRWTNLDMDCNLPTIRAKFFWEYYVEGVCFLDSYPEILYALLRHMINVFEASFYRFGHYHFGEDLKSDEWRWKILGGSCHLVNQPWDKVHAVEVKDWVTLLKCVREAGKLPKDALADPETFSPPDPTPAFQILGMAKYIRNRTFHRDEPMIGSQLRLALKIPRVLKDPKMADELEAIYEVIVNDPELKAPSSEWVLDILFSSQPEFGTYLEVETKILSMLEEGSFYFAQREDCRLLDGRYWTDPNSGEMQIYACNWEEKIPDKYWDLAEAMKPEECANLDGQFFLHEHLRKAVMRSATALRNSVSHRDLGDDWNVRYDAWNAMLCFILMDDRIRAIEVESLVEAFLRKISQTDALLRLYNASWNDEPARRLAVVEVCRRKGIKADPSDCPRLELSSVSPLSRSDTGSKWPEVSKSAKAKWSLKYDEEWDLWDSAIHKFVLCNSMHETLTRERPME